MLESVVAPFLRNETNQVRTGGSQNLSTVGNSLTRLGSLSDLGFVNTHGGNGRNNEYVNK